MPSVIGRSKCSRDGGRESFRIDDSLSRSFNRLVMNSRLTGATENKIIKHEIEGNKKRSNHHLESELFRNCSPFVFRFCIHG